MNDKIFLDSNIVVYCFSKSDEKKQKVAQSLALRQNAIISTQVINETVNVLNKKYGISWIELRFLVNEFKSNFQVHIVQPIDIVEACSVAEKFKYSFYDSLIVSTAITCNCDILYSEDLRDEHLLYNKVKIVNPFK